MSGESEPVLDMLKSFASQVWGYNDDEAEMAADVLYQCRRQITTGAVVGGATGAALGLGVASIPGWAVGAFGGIVAGALRCGAVKGIPAMGLHRILHASNELPIPENENLWMASSSRDNRLKQEMDRLIALRQYTNG